MGIFSSLFSRSSSSNKKYHRKSHKGNSHYRRGYKHSSRKPGFKNFFSKLSSRFSRSSSWS